MTAAVPTPAKGRELITNTAFLSISLLKTSRYQIRDAAFGNFEELENLANSIKTVGLLELPVVRKDPEDPGYFEIISGHRRIQAVSKFLGWKEIECKVSEELDEFEAFRLSITENMQRSNLSPYEEGVAFLLSQKLFGLSDEEIANQLHKSRQMVASRRELATAANHYVKYADSSIVNAFLRHFSAGHKDILSKLDDAGIIKHSVTMIARGGSVRHLQRFIELFTDEDKDMKISDHQLHMIPSRRKLKMIDEVLSVFEQLKKVPTEYTGKIDLLKNSYLNVDLSSQRVATDLNMLEEHKFRCPSCRETFEIDRKLVPEEDKVLFIINPKNPAIKTRKAVYSFPVYKVKDDS